MLVRMKQRNKHGKRSGFGRDNRDGKRRDGERKEWRKDRNDKPKRSFKDKKDRDRKPESGFKSHRPEKRFETRPERAERPAGEPREQKGPRPNLYGFHAVRAAWLNPARQIEALYVTESAEAEFDETLIQGRQAGLRRPAAQTVEKHELDRMLPREAVHQGIAIVTKPLEDVFIQDFIIKSQEQTKTILLMLDQVTDPHNVGAILRSASAFGATGVIMQRMHAPELTGVLAKTASGAVDHIPVAFETNLSRSIEDLKENGFFVLGLDERGKREIGDVMRNNKGGDTKIVFVLGAEGPGMRRLIKENCDELVRLPTGGPIASLNVSNAAAVALYALLS